MSGILVFLKLTPNIHFLPLFNFKAQIVICHVFLDTLRISWYTKEFFNWKLPFMSKHKRGWEFFSKYMDKGLPRYYVYDYCKIIVNVFLKKKYTTHTMCDQCIPSMTNFTHDKLMATYKKLTPSLYFLPLFNCSQLSFAMCF